MPLADGRVARGARGVTLPPADPRVGAALAVLGVRAVDPAVAADGRVRRLLERLGATGVSGPAALDLPAVASAVAALADGDDASDEDVEQERLDAVLTLVAAAVSDGGVAGGDLPWLGVLPLPDADGDLAPAAELALPGSPAARLLDPDAVGLVDAGLVERWGASTLRAVGVLDGLALLRAARRPARRAAGGGAGGARRRRRAGSTRSPTSPTPRSARRSAPWWPTWSPSATSTRYARTPGRRSCACSRAIPRCARRC